MLNIKLSNNLLIKFILGISIYFTLSVRLMQSQTIMVKLSIEWKKDYRNIPEKIRAKLKDKCIPFLTITYTNETNSDVYFLKIINNHNHFPFLGTGSLGGVFHKDTVLTYFPYLNYSGKKFYVYIKGLNYYEGSWEVVSDTTNLESEGPINRILGDFYLALRKQSDIEALSSQFYFRKDDITESGIKRNINKNFIFLKKNESFSDQYNLIGFYLVGGDYEFYLPDKYFVDFVLAESPENPYLMQKLNLPNQVNGYKLYSQPFSSNNLNIKFIGIIKNER